LPIRESGITTGDSLEDALLRAPVDERERLYQELYDRIYERPSVPSSMPSPRRRRRIATYRKMVGSARGAVLELGCGVGDLTYALAVHERQIVGADISLTAVKTARSRQSLWGLAQNVAERVSFLQMNATDLAFEDGSLDCVLSTSMIEHLHPEDVQPHLREVHRVLKPAGRYLVWCPNGLGHHQDRDFHLSMFSHRQLIAAMRQAGFERFQSLLFNRYPLWVDATVKVFLEDWLTRLKSPILWSHLGVRNILLLGQRAG
jgi:ubiquinone/menaquinone biosynthesis C-methylase UbiE